ncbi:MAG: helix-turn-helix transcriptional regulator [Oscillospiraceae bacterium]|nr:helix-turn-helix transcriptional regulator [Candidatus Equicaccousia limihippi]
MQLVSLRHAWPENADFVIDRPNGIKTYTFLHFFNSVELLCDGKIVTTKPGACIFYGVLTPQWFKSNDLLVHDWMHFIGADLLETYGIKTDKIYYFADGSFITDIFKEIESEFYGDNLCGKRLIDCKLHEFFIKFSRAVANGLPSFNDQNAKKLSTARQLLISRSERRWTVENIAAAVNLSPSRFHALYKAEYGTTPMQDVISSRIHKAQNLLIATDKSISDIAEECGYDNTNHFNRQFKKQTGLNPGEYRKANRTN